MSDWRDDFGFDRDKDSWRFGDNSSTVDRVEWAWNGGPLKLHPLEDLTGEAEDKGFFGVHVTADPEEWLCILVEDYDRDISTAIVMTIQIDGLLLIDDPNPVDRDDVPDSFILVSKTPTIPADRLSETDGVDVDCEMYG